VWHKETSALFSQRGAPVQHVGDDALAQLKGVSAPAPALEMVGVIDSKLPTLHFLGLCGSLRRVSSNLALLQAALQLLPEGVEMNIADPLDRLPHFNPDLDVVPPPAGVERWRKEVADADAVVICSPEYAFGVPGVLKNALDWLVPSGELYEKPVGVITASPNHGGAARAQQHLLDTLTAQHALRVEGGSAALPFVRTRFDTTGALTDPEASTILQTSLRALAAAARAARSS
jgi:chromate reductase, NAD(P)H dehydrogenase (quinone)